MPHTEIPTGPTLDQEPLAAIAFPNPIVNHTNIKLKSEIAQNVDITVFDASGRTIKVGQYELNSGDNNILLEFGSEVLSIGVYNVLISSESNYRLLKLIKN